MAQIEGIIRALASSQNSVAREEALGFAKSLEPRVVLDERLASSDSLRILRVRLDIQNDALARAKSSSTRERRALMASALARAVNWWSAHPAEGVRYVCLSFPPDVSFLLWFDQTTGEFISGFESRDGTKLTYARGKEFFGSDWEPTPDPSAI